MSVGFCQCEVDEWQTLQKGQWSAIISPFEKRYLDIRLKDKTLMSFTLSIEEGKVLFTNLSCHINSPNILCFNLYLDMCLFLM